MTINDLITRLQEIQKLVGFPLPVQCTDRLDPDDTAEVVRVVLDKDRKTGKLAVFIEGEP